MSRKLLVVGGDSRLGASVASYARNLGCEVDVTSRRPGRGIQLDLACDLSSWELPGKYDFCFIAASLCSLDACQKDPEGSRLINVVNTLKIASRLIDSGCRILFPSSNAVFDGSTAFPDENAACHPLNEYGRQKMEVEKELLALDEGSQIIRFTKIVYPGMSLLAGWRRELQAGRTISPFSEMWFSPVPIHFAASASVAVLLDGGKGIWHVSGAEDISYAQAAQFIAADLGVEQSLVRSKGMAELGLPAAPRYSGLGHCRLVRELQMTPPPVKEAVVESSLGKEY